MGSGASIPDEAPFWAADNVDTVSQAANLANHIVTNKGSLGKDDVESILRRVG